MALQMLMGDRAKYLGLLFGLTFTAFLVTFAPSFFCGMMTRGFALIAENPAADVWVMHPAVQGAEQSVSIPSNTLNRVRSVPGVSSAVALVLATADVHFANGRFQPVQVIGVDDATLAGIPALQGGREPGVLRAADTAAFADGGTKGKLESPALETDGWTPGKPHLGAATHPLAVGDEVLVNDARVIVAGRTRALPRFPPRPLLYTTYSNTLRILPRERRDSGSAWPAPPPEWPRANLRPGSRPPPASAPAPASSSATTPTGTTCS